MQNLATIETIHSIAPHPNADKLVLGKVLGFDIVVKKDEFKHGEKVVFVWPDTLMQVKPWNQFLDKKMNGSPIKVKSIKLRGSFSTGVVFPLSILDGYAGPIENGEEVAVFLGVEKYVKDDGSGSNVHRVGGFPSHIISKTDEDLAQSKIKTREEFVGKKCYLTLKIDGQSFTCIHKDGEITHCSRSLVVGGGLYVETSRKYGLPEKIKEHGNIAIQAEQFGPKIQQNKLQRSSVELAIFDAKNLDTGAYYGLNELQELCSRLGIPMVPLLKVFDFTEETTYDALQEMADTLEYLAGVPAEGMVLRPVVPVYSEVLRGKLSVKFINRNYKD